MKRVIGRASESARTAIDLLAVRVRRAVEASMMVEIRGGKLILGIDAVFALRGGRCRSCSQDRAGPIDGGAFTAHFARGPMCPPPPAPARPRGGRGSHSNRHSTPPASPGGVRLQLLRPFNGRAGSSGQATAMTAARCPSCSASHSTD
jgi:hypothetical protein